MSDDKATGDDGISCRLLEMSKHIIVDSLTCLINKSITTGHVPKGLKKARVIPIYKTGNMSTPGNYRPISVLSVVSKILEKAVHFQLCGFLNENEILYPNQSGFRPLHSTATALMQQLDTVDHDILLHKLTAIGCSDTSIQWFVSYLSNREQMVCSSSYRVTTQVPSSGPHRLWHGN